MFHFDSGFRFFIILIVCFNISIQAQNKAKKTKSNTKSRPALYNYCTLNFYTKYSISKDRKIIPIISGCQNEGTFKVVSNNGTEVFVSKKMPFSWDLNYMNNIIPTGKYMWQYTFFNSKRQTNTNFGSFEIIE